MRGAPLHVLQMEGLGVFSECLDAVIDMNRGDARRAIYLLQSLCLGALSRCDNRFVEPACGLPIPSDNNGIFFQSFLNGTFAVNFRWLSSRLSGKGFALAQVMSALAEKVVAPDKKIEIYQENRPEGAFPFANIERSLSDGGKESLRIGAAI
ncbi:unnamed protein product, partial [Scytosiphon promiscuus]